MHLRGLKATSISLCLGIGRQWYEFILLTLNDRFDEGGHFALVLLLFFTAINLVVRFIEWVAGSATIFSAALLWFLVNGMVAFRIARYQLNVVSFKQRIIMLIFANIVFAIIHAAFQIIFREDAFSHISMTMFITVYYLGIFLSVFAHLIFNYLGNNMYKRWQRQMPAAEQRISKCKKSRKRTKKQ